MSRYRKTVRLVVNSLFASGLLLSAGTVGADETTSTNTVATNTVISGAEALADEFVKKSLFSASADAKGIIKDKIKKELSDPDTYNSALGFLENKLSANDSLSKLFKDLHLRFKTFNSAVPGDGAALGVDYNYQKSIANRQLNKGNDPMILNLEFKAEGQVAFDKETNPNDFLDTSFKLHLFQSRGGYKVSAEADSLKPSPTEMQQALLDAAKLKGTPEEIDKSPEWQRFNSQFRKGLRNQFMWDLAANGALESNQSFSKKQYVYGMHLGLVTRIWDENSKWAKFNVFDWPFALIRSLDGGGLKPSARSLPTLLVGLDAVDPQNDADRFAADPDMSVYPRIRAEFAYKTKVIDIKNEPLTFFSGLRYFREIDAAAGVRAAELDQARYAAVGLTYNVGGIEYHVTYANGKLPLDRKSDSTIGAGLRYNF